MNWSGGNVRSTPSRAFLLLVHLSRIEPFAVVAVLTVLAADAPFDSARAPAVPIAAIPPARSSPLRVVLASSPPSSAGPFTCSDIAHLRVEAGPDSARCSQNAHTIAMRTNAYDR